MAVFFRGESQRRARNTSFMMSCCGIENCTPQSGKSMSFLRLGHGSIVHPHRPGRNASCQTDTGVTIMMEHSLFVVLREIHPQTVPAT
eukprot:2835601-Rhodomonas_salina.5